MTNDPQKPGVTFVIGCRKMSGEEKPEDALHVHRVIFQEMRAEQEGRTVVRQNVAPEKAFPLQLDFVVFFQILM